MIHLFFFSDTATTHIYTLSLHDALPISAITQPHAITLAAANDRDLKRRISSAARVAGNGRRGARAWGGPQRGERSEEHTSELQSLTNLVCRLLLEKKKKKKYSIISTRTI